jgi:hypothetical protein
MMLFKYFRLYDGKLFPKSLQQHWDFYKYFFQLQAIVFILFHAAEFWTTAPSAVLFFIASLVMVTLATLLMYAPAMLLLLIVDKVEELLKKKFEERSEKDD